MSFGLGGHAAQIFQLSNLRYHHVAIPNHASYANGHIICRTRLTKNDLIKR
ncbi:MAG: hypothetical protein OXI87_14820 [Albidovulum sp.]|nr:hypothetical protein [Albidovulum sp.]MDE0306130.1 hypothetical protein [Albidovulum sp.]MDE0531839.1 hypothetical protein [Albidovulum sp.]